MMRYMPREPREALRALMDEAGVRAAGEGEGEGGELSVPIVEAAGELRIGEVRVSVSEPESPELVPEVLFFDILLGQTTRSLDLHAPATCLAASLDGYLIAAGFADGTVRVCSYMSEDSWQEGKSHYGAGMGAVAFLGNRKLVGSAEGVMHVWSLPPDELARIVMQSIESPRKLRR